ncbi:MAG: hypothetical protein IPI67_00895 [Myxococcales bacterium]|nr:hypothetical protein [Myxococcales bacterium]
MRPTVALACGLLLVSCGPAPTAEAPHASPTAPPANPLVEAVDAGVGASPEAEADRIVAGALRVVERHRELAAKGPVKGHSISRAEMVAFVKKELATEVPPAIIGAETQMLFALGVVPASFDYEESLLELMGSQLAGFYDPKQKAMFLARDLPPAERSATLAHELVHALQDQHYDLEKRLKFREDSGDEQSAIHALAEGDATSAMLDHVLATRGLRAVDVSDEIISLEARGAIELSMESANVPGILKRSVVSPYIDGLSFVNWSRRRGGWASVDAIWRDLPSTTEQLLHPEKYVSREKAEPVPIPSAPPGGPTEVIYRDILGEQSVRILLEEWMPRRAAAESASDWAGDRVAVFRKENQYALAWHLRYDNEAAATRGLAAFARGVLRPAGARPAEYVSPDRAKAAAKAKHVCAERSAAGPIAAVLAGRDVALVAGPFAREGAGPKGLSKCAEATRWAGAVAKQR